MAADDDLTVDVLGPLRARRGDDELVLGGAKQRCVLALLALQVGHVVSTERLIDGIWGEDPPDKATGTLQVYVSNLRKVLGPTPKGPTIVGRAPGYVLDLPPASVDAVRFSSAVIAARKAAAKDADGAVAQLHEALALWRGDALADLPEHATSERTKLDGDRMAALAERLDLELHLGRHRSLVPELEGLVDRFPLDERLWQLLMLALYRCGRQADALGAYQRAKDLLDRELGLDPSPELRALQSAVLAQDTQLMGAITAPKLADRTVRAPAAAGTPAWLVFADGRRLPLTSGNVVLGRGDDCDVTLNDPLVSRRHAVVRSTVDGHTIEDDGSTNGTIVGGLQLGPRQPHLLAEADEVVIGSATLRFTLVPA